VAERVRAAIEATDWERVATGLVVTASLGIAPWHGDVTAALKCADQALYEAKRMGRNRVCAAAE
jgi:diguanylate cyclase (GGDEF)-like protein